MTAAARIALALCIAVPALAARATVLYKTVDERGVIQFSDVPPEAGVAAKRILVPESPSAVPGEIRSADAMAAGGPTPEEKMRMADAAVQRASLQVDLAEHALAVARRNLWTPVDLNALRVSKMGRADRDRVEYYRKNLRVAQQQLADILREKRRADAPTLTASLESPTFRR